MIFLFCSCALWGIGRSAALSRRAGSLERLVAMLGVLSEELSYNQTPIREATARISARSTGAAKDFLSGVRGYMSAGYSPPESWEKAAGELSDIEKSDRQELSSLALFLGGSDIEGQRAAISRCRRALEERRAEATERCGRLSRVYTTLGVLGGLAAVVIAL